MYIIERLKQDFPNYSKELDEFDVFLRKYHDTPYFYKIFDDSADGFNYLQEAYKIGPGNSGYTRNMAYYEKALNYNKDFLQFFIETMFDDKTDYRNLTAEEMRNIIDEHYKNKGKR